jgi:hypothetical protein
MNKFKTFLSLYREEILLLSGGLSLSFSLMASVLMYNVHNVEEWTEAQRVWTGALLGIIVYLCLDKTLPSKPRYAPSKLLTTIQNGIYAYVLFLVFIKAKVICSFLFHSSNTVSGSFPAYYWICVLIGLSCFMWNSIKLISNAKK